MHNWPIIDFNEHQAILFRYFLYHILYTVETLHTLPTRPTKHCSPCTIQKTSLNSKFWQVANNHINKSLAHKVLNQTQFFCARCKRWNACVSMHTWNVFQSQCMREMRYVRLVAMTKTKKKCDLLQLDKSVTQLTFWINSFWNKKINISQQALSVS